RPLGSAPMSDQVCTGQHPQERPECETRHPFAGEPFADTGEKVATPQHPPQHPLSFRHWSKPFCS
ncbi:hypothetical protein BgiMline_012623, partial [Biomphalaria glabrata]